MKRKRNSKKESTTVVYWVTVRNEDTGELIGNAWSFTDLKKAEAKKMEQEEAVDPKGIQTIVSIETLIPGFENYPAAIKKRQS